MLEKKEREKEKKNQQDKPLLVVISSEVVEHETDSMWFKNKGDGCTQSHCRQGHERALLPRIRLLYCNLHRYSHNFLHVDSKSSTSFKNDVIVCVVKIKNENFQCVSNVAKLFPNAFKGLFMKSMTKFRQDFTALFLPLI